MAKKATISSADAANALAGMVNASEAAKVLGFTRQRMSVLCKQGRIPGAVKIGSSWFISQNDLDEFSKINRAHGVTLKNLASPAQPKKTAKKKPKK